MLLCDRTRRVGTVTETELRVGLRGSPYSPLLKYLGLEGEHVQAPSRYHHYNRTKKGLEEHHLVAAIKDFKAHDQAMGPAYASSGAGTGNRGHGTRPFRPTGAVAVRKQMASLEDYQRRHREPGCNCRNPACQEGHRTYK